MLDISKTIESKSDHLSADDLIGGAFTIEITKVSIVNGDRPVVIDYVGGDGKSFLPCKTMRRVMAGAWGVDGNDYIGRHMTLYRDSSVVFGGKEVGGIRISHISGISETLKLTLSSSRGKKSLFTVKPLLIEKQSIKEVDLDSIKQEIDNATSEKELLDIYNKHRSHKLLKSEIAPMLTAKKEVILKITETEAYFDVNIDNGENNV